MLSQIHIGLLKERVQGMSIKAELRENVTVVVTVYASIYSVLLLQDGKYVNHWYSNRLLNIKKRLAILEEKYGKPFYVTAHTDQALADAAKKELEKH